MSSSQLESERTPRHGHLVLRAEFHCRKPPWHGVVPDHDGHLLIGEGAMAGTEKATAIGNLLAPAAEEATSVGCGSWHRSCSQWHDADCSWQHDAKCRLASTVRVISAAIKLILELASSNISRRR